MLGEFDLIERYFVRKTAHCANTSTKLSIGDDCALFEVPKNHQLAISSDMLIEGRHFLSTVDPAKLGHKALAVNLSDLAACGAKPEAFTLALALPSADENWLKSFSEGLFRLADEHQCELIGGDTTKGSLNICITVFGSIPLHPKTQKTQALLRSGAQVGDDIYVSGNLGDARLALEVFRGNLSVSQAVFDSARLRMEMPTPRVQLGQALRAIASSAIDISDGLLGDLAHILKRSNVGATIETQKAIQLIANSPMNTSASSDFDHQKALSFVLAGGDDYELVFTAAQNQRLAVENAALQSQTPITRIGQIDAEKGLRLIDSSGKIVPNLHESFDHFKN